MKNSRAWCWGLALLALACDDGPAPWHNHAPWTPLVTGPAEVFAGVPATFDVTVYDPDGHQLRVYVAWGDGDTNDYGEFVASGQTVQFEHTWHEVDSFSIRARCHDSEPLFSDWSNGRLVVVVPPR